MYFKYFWLLMVVFFTSLIVYAQPKNTSIKEWNGNNDKPLVFYITGDGGFNSFSTKLCTSINQSGYAVAALNAKDYFWSQKTPQQAAFDIGKYIGEKLMNRPNQHWILVGYSFGADVSSFIINRMAEPEKRKLNNVVLLAPSASTDFVIRLFDMAGGNKKRSMDVVAEINKLGVLRTSIITDSNEKSFPTNKVLLKNCKQEILPGGHHFDGSVDVVAQTIMNHF